MENLDNNDIGEVGEVSQVAEIAAVQEKQAKFSLRSWMFGFFSAMVFILGAIFLHQQFVKPRTKAISEAVNANRTDANSTENSAGNILLKNDVSKIFTAKTIISKGSTIGNILSVYGLSYQNVVKILKVASSKKVNLIKLKPGQVLYIQYIRDASNNKIFQDFTINISRTSKLKVLRDQNSNEFHASILPIALNREVVVLNGTIRRSLMVSAIRAGVPIANLMAAANACSYEIDFQRDIKNGNSFNILLEKFTSQEDGSIFFGKTLYFSLNLNKKQYRIYRFKPKNGPEEFFTEKYQTARRGLLKTPVPVFRISGRFGMRKKHPILGYSVMHRGVDFAAPRGTKIFAAGNGVISTIGRDKGLGKYIKIRHRNGLVTVYGHISRFAKKLKRGSKVTQGQIIAFVGSTGLATGPHLHYEIRLNGRHVNPLKFKLPSMQTLRGADKQAFQNHKSYIHSLLENKLVA